MNKKTDNKRREMSKKVENNVKKGAEFVEGALDELGNAGWSLFTFWLR